MKKHRTLSCEVRGCGFDYLATYGELGRDYAQVHHLKGLVGLSKGRRIRLEELAIVCANCHVMIHRHGECRSLRDIANALAQNGPSGA